MSVIVPATEALNPVDPVEADSDAQRFRSTFDLLPIGAAHAALDGSFLDVNPALCSMLEYSREECLGLSLHAIVLPADAAVLRVALEVMAHRPAVPSQSRELRLRCKNGNEFWANVSITRMPDARSPCLLVVIDNIGARKEAEEQLARRAHHDLLTGMPNRALFREHLKQALERFNKRNGLIAVLSIDLDHFKLVNDTMGHKAGDLLLQKAALRIGACGPTSVGRLGGDEFGALLTGVQSERDVAMIADQIRIALARPFHINGRDAFVTASIGITLCPSDSDQVDTLLSNADTAMYRAVELGRNNCQFFTADMNKLMVKRARLEGALHKALENNELFLQYQPQADVWSGRIVGVEALMRWQHPEYGVVSPADFIPVAEETGLIVPMGEWAIRTACRQNKAWQDAGLRPLTVAVNLSARQFRRPGLVELVERALKDSGLPGYHLELELTESMMMDNTEEVIATMLELKALGVKLAIDDFGTGYSNLGYLKRLPIDALKIDKSFISGIGENDDGAIASTVVALGRNLGLKVIAEGVEHVRELDFLFSRGCDMVQGYLIGKPMSPEQMVSLLTSQAG